MVASPAQAWLLLDQQEPGPALPDRWVPADQALVDRALAHLASVGPASVGPALVVPVSLGLLAQVQALAHQVVVAVLLDRLVQAVSVSTGPLAWYLVQMTLAKTQTLRLQQAGGISS